MFVPVDDAVAGVVARVFAPILGEEVVAGAGGQEIVAEEEGGGAIFALAIGIGEVGEEFVSGGVDSLRGVDVADGKLPEPDGKARGVVHGAHEEQVVRPMVGVPKPR